MTTIRLLAVIEAATITGPAKNLLRFAEAARDHRFGAAVDVSVITFERGQSKNLFLDSAQRAGIATFPVPESGAFDRRVLKRLRAAARELAPDLIQTHAVKSHFLSALAGFPDIAPWIAFHHGYTWPDSKALLYNQLDRWSLPRAQQVLTVSSPFREEMIARGVRPEKIEVIHNAIDADWGRRNSTAQKRNELRDRLGVPDDKQIVLIVGRLSKEKDHKTLIRAVGRMRRDRSVHLIIVGDGPERSNITRQIKESGLEAEVSITGQVPSAEPYYGIADVCVLSSLSEGSPNALLEAMAARVPTVATQVGGIPEMVTDGESALLVRPTDEVGMSQAITRILKGPEFARLLVAKAHALIQERYTPERRAQKLIEVYGRLLGLTARGNESAIHIGP
ncbi:MAG: glycosyltransferase family 4 protein [Acidobacteriaceae bacterium]|nr:glycosyltransferase family 4 protein [Acidobacteriaceae bacterium]